MSPRTWGLCCSKKAELALSRAKFCACTADQLPHQEKKVMDTNMLAFGQTIPNKILNEVCEGGWSAAILRPKCASIHDFHAVHSPRINQGDKNRVDPARKV